MLACVLENWLLHVAHVGPFDGVIKHQAQRGVVIGLSATAQLTAHFLATPFTELGEHRLVDAIYVVPAKEWDQVAVNGTDVIVVTSTLGFIFSNSTSATDLNFLETTGCTALASTLASNHCSSANKTPQINRAITV